MPPAAVSQRALRHTMPDPRGGMGTRAALPRLLVHTQRWAGHPRHRGNAYSTEQPPTRYQSSYGKRALARTLAGAARLLEPRLPRPRACQNHAPTDTSPSPGPNPGACRVQSVATTTHLPRPHACHYRRSERLSFQGGGVWLRGSRRVSMRGGVAAARPMWIMVGVFGSGDRGGCRCGCSGRVMSRRCGGRGRGGGGRVRSR